MDQLAKACPVPIVGAFGGCGDDTSEAALSEDDDDVDEMEEEEEEEDAMLAAEEIQPEETGIKSKKASRVRTTISDEQVMYTFSGRYRRSSSSKLLLVAGGDFEVLLRAEPQAEARGAPTDCREHWPPLQGDQGVVPGERMRSLLKGRNNKCTNDI